MKKKKQKSGKKAKKRVKKAEKQAPVPKDMKRPVSALEKIIYALLIAGALVMAYKVIDYYTGWGDTAKVIKRLTMEAEKHAIYKRYAETVKIYESIIRKYSNDEKYRESVRQVRLSLAKAYKDAEMNIEAINLYRELLEEYKGQNNDMYAWLLLELGDAYNNIYSSDDAIKTYKMVVSNFENSDWAAEALFGIADAYKDKKEPKNAIMYYDQIIKRYKKGFLSAEAMTNIGKIYEDEGKDKMALKVYKKVVDDYPEIVTEYARIRCEILSERLKK